MDFENFDVEQPQEQNNQEGPYSTPVSRQVPPIPPAGPSFSGNRRKTSLLSVIFRIFFVLSIIGNLFMFLMLVVVGSMTSGAASTEYDEGVIFRGDHKNKIAVINIEGVIQNELGQSVREQFNAAAQDENVKAVIVRIASPGGTVSASDQIHHEISNYKLATGNPVIAFMQTVAASGGYYSAVACDEIVAEPTVITGSIGVIMNSFVLKDLLEEKLGITPVTIKSGEKKDWPSTFNEVTEEQVQYLQEKLIGPAYGRFVELIVKGREGKLTEDQIRNLADGSIFSAQEALENKLVDEIGYIESAVKKAEKMAGIYDAHVFEYKPVFSFASLMSAKTNAMFPIDRDALTHLMTPQLLYLWDINVH